MTLCVNRLQGVNYSLYSDAPAVFCGPWNPRTPPLKGLNTPVFLIAWSHSGTGLNDHSLRREWFVKPAKAKRLQAHHALTGRHPLSGIVPDIDLHPHVGAGHSDDQPTCGTCFWRIKGRRTHPHARRCGYGQRDLAGAHTITRSWWPACAQWTPK